MKHPQARGGGGTAHNCHLHAHKSLFVHSAYASYAASKYLIMGNLMIQPRPSVHWQCKEPRPCLAEVASHQGYSMRAPAARMPTQVR